MKFLRLNILALFGMLAVICPALLGASPTIVTARLDSAVMMMGKMNTLHIDVEQDEGVMGFFPLLRQIRENGIITVCNDSVEFRAPSSVDTVKTAGRLKISYAIPVQSFDSGFYKLPDLVYVVPGDSVVAPGPSLKIVPVDVTAETPISDYANVSKPENGSIFDNVPDWIIDFWWLILILIVALCGAVYLWRKYKRDGYIIPRKPEPTPYEVAISALNQLKERKLWEQGMEKEYFTDLTDIIRNYLYGRFSINAMEMTSRQIMGALKRNKETADKRPLIRQILDMADFVKFAKVRPLPADNIQAFDNALSFVEQTKPVEVPEEENSGTEKSKKGSDKTKKVKKGGKNA